MGLQQYCIGLQQNTYTGDPFFMPGETQPKSKYPLYWRPICRNDSLLGHVVGEDRKQVLNPLPVVLPKHRTGLVFWMPLSEIVLYLLLEKGHQWITNTHGQSSATIKDRLHDFKIIEHTMIKLQNSLQNDAIEISISNNKKVKFSSFFTIFYDLL